MRSIWGEGYECWLRNEEAQGGGMGMVVLGRRNFKTILMLVISHKFYACQFRDAMLFHVMYSTDSLQGVIWSGKSAAKQIYMQNKCIYKHTCKIQWSNMEPLKAFGIYKCKFVNAYVTMLT